MITPAYVQTMAAYNSEMNRRVYGAASRLDEAERRAERGAFWGSLHGTLCHLMWADQMWMSRFDGWDRPTHVQQDSRGLYDDFDMLSAARVDADARLELWAKAVDAVWLAGDLAWVSGSSQTRRVANRGLLVMHMFNHQTHHRGQAHALLTRSGQDTGATDLPWVLAV